MAYAIGQCIINNVASGTAANEITIDNLAKKAKNAIELMGDSNYIPVLNVEKIGIQAPPGEIILVNGEPIEIGRTGTYELLFNEVSIVSLKPLSKAIFIIDYKYSL